MRPTTALLALLACSTPALATTPAPTADALNAAVALLGEEASPAKAVPRKDKAAGDIVGTVTGVADLGFPCNGPLRAVHVGVAVRGWPFQGIVLCAGPVAPVCLGLQPGRRVRFQGALIPLPDPTTPGFVACDPATWQLVSGGHALHVVKVQKK